MKVHLRTSEMYESLYSKPVKFYKHYVAKQNYLKTWNISINAY
jgi:hypothetical protein